MYSVSNLEWNTHHTRHSMKPIVHTVIKEWLVGQKSDLYVNSASTIMDMSSVVSIIENFTETYQLYDEHFGVGEHRLA